MAAVGEHPRASRARWVAVVALSSSLVGLGLEWFRRRGTCESGDNAPDTLVVSVLLIVVGGGLIGLVAVALSVAAMLRHGIATNWPALALAIAAVASVGVLVASAGGGPGSWFQYCAT